MAAWRLALRRAWLSGSIASVLSTAVVSACGRGQRNRPARGINTTSHWIWGERATRQDAPSLRYTALGYAIHHASSVFWATGYERWRLAPHLPLAQRPVALAISVAAVAWTVDYRVVPPRLTPGFERHLSRRGMVLTYAACAAGLVLAAGLRRRKIGDADRGRHEAGHRITTAGAHGEGLRASSIHAAQQDVKQSGDNRASTSLRDDTAVAIPLA